MAHVLRVGSASPAAHAAVRRRAVKAVVIRGDALLMLRSGPAGDLKFPGGGVLATESDRQALRRELAEECGADLTRMGGALLEVIETRPDHQRPHAVFEMVSLYFPCSVGTQIQAQDLDDYERELALTPVWVTLDEALTANGTALSAAEPSPWVERETQVLRWLASAGGLAGVAAFPP